MLPLYITNGKFMKKIVILSMIITLCIHVTYSMEQENAQTIVLHNERISDCEVFSLVKIYGKEVAHAYYQFANLKTSLGQSIDDAIVINEFATMAPFDLAKCQLNKTAQERLIKISQGLIEHICIQAFTTHGKAYTIVQLSLGKNSVKEIAFFQKIGFISCGTHEHNGTLFTYLKMERPFTQKSNPRIYDAVRDWRWKQFLNSDVIERNGRQDYYYDRMKVPLSQTEEQLSPQP